MAHEEIDHGAAAPVYRQLAAILRRRIIAGEIPPGRALPSEPRLEQEYGLSRNTTRKAIAILRDVDGLVETVPGRGSYVVDPLPASEQR